MNTTDVLQRMDDEWRRLMDLVAQIAPRAFVQPSTDGWSPKDHLAHLAAWEGFLLAMLEHQDPYASMDVGDVKDKETDEINEAVFQARRSLAPDVVLATLSETHRRVHAAIEALSDADLRRPASEFQPGGAAGEPSEETLLDEIEWNTWGHYEKHIAWLTALLAQ